MKEKREAVASFLHVWTVFEQQVTDTYASQKAQTFSNLCKPETHFGHAPGQYWAGALLDSINLNQNTIITI